MYVHRGDDVLSLETFDNIFKRFSNKAFTVSKPRFLISVTITKKGKNNKKAKLKSCLQNAGMAAAT